MIIGVDFDNTIACYDKLFHKVALERNLIPAEVGVNKSNVRDYLRKIGHEDAWTELQGLIYGVYIKEASSFPGVKKFFEYCKLQNIRTYIISHKTRYPFIGEKCDLHESARKWIESQGLYDEKFGLDFSSVFFELTNDEKINRIVNTGCTHFIDDLPEFLEESDFPNGVERILFDFHDIYENSGIFKRMTSWISITRFFNDGGK